MRNEYLAAENRILRSQIKGRLLLSDAEKKTLADIGHRLGRKALEDVANTARPDTISGLVSKVSSPVSSMAPKQRRYPGRPRSGVAHWKTWLYGWPKRMSAGATIASSARWPIWAMTNLGYTLSDETVGNILRRNGTPARPQSAKQTYGRGRLYSRTHMAVLAGTDFFTVEVLTLRGLVTYYVLFFIHLREPSR